jgi:anthranilate synthase
MKELFVTRGGIHVERVQEPLPLEAALDHVYGAIDRARGCILASDYEYPGRYSRWDIGFIDPPFELVSRGRDFSLRALNPRGSVLLEMLGSCVNGCADVERCAQSEGLISGRVRPMQPGFAEEERSRQSSIFSVLRSLCDTLACEDEYLSMFGAFGYDLVFQFEPIRFRHDRDAAGPDCHLFLADRITAIDHQKKTAFRLSYEFSTAGGLTTATIPVTGERIDLPRPAEFSGVRCDHKPGEYAGKVERIRQGCLQGDFFEVVLSQEFSTACTHTPRELFNRLRSTNPSPYDFIINLGAEQLIGASPEMFVRVNGREVETCPISGTVKRGAGPMQDAEQIRILLTSRKDEAELTMCTDVDRNDKSRVCVPGSVELVGRRMVESYSRLFHTVDHVKGMLLPDCDMFDAFLSHMWACTLTGAPKPIAMQTIEDLENSARRWYGGCVGLFTFNGQLNTGITIRTIHLQDGTARVRSGATLLYDSVPEDEEQETRVKASAFLSAVTQPAAEHSAPEGRRPCVKRPGIRVLFVDNQDSFVHTLANYVRQTGVEVITLRGGFAEERFDELQPDALVISPGPCTPEKMGVVTLVGQAAARGLPMFGVCLGHQGIAQYFGAELGLLPRPMHGRETVVTHQGEGVFKNLPSPMTAGRYHSLYVKKEGLPACLEITAESDDGIIMALRHRDLPICSVQFHPESILTLQDDAGLKLIANVIDVLTARL